MAPHDDLYFAKMADYLIHGQWMGPYNQLTLIKGPFFEFFLVLSGLTGLPLLLNETVFYLMACLVLYSAVSPLAKSAWWRLLLFALVLFSPASLITYWTLRVYREFVYASLTLFVIAFSVGLFLRIAVRPWIQFLWAARLGVSMGAFMLCREEGPWIYPVLGLSLAACLWGIWRGAMDRKMAPVGDCSLPHPHLVHRDLRCLVSQLLTLRFLGLLGKHGPGSQSGA